MKGNTMTYLPIDHVNAVMADRLRDAEQARLVRQVSWRTRRGGAQAETRAPLLRLRDPLNA